MSDAPVTPSDAPEAERELEELATEELLATATTKANAVAAAEELARRLTALELELEADPFGRLIAALAAAQGQFPTIEKRNVGEVRGTTKDGKPYSYEYRYADLGDVLAAVRPVLSRYGLALIQRTVHGERAVRLVTELHHAAGGVIQSDVELGQSPGNPQQFGGALTYLRRYEAVTLLGIAAEEDRDAQDVTPAGRNAAAPAPELPAWATMLTRERAGAELGPLLIELLGREAATGAYRAVRDSLGGAPAVLIPYTALILDTLAAGDDVELSNRLDEVRNAKAAKVAAEQDAAAEAPDAPAPEPEADAEPVEEPADTEADAPDPDVEPVPDPDGERDEPDPVEAAAEAAEAAPAGTVTIELGDLDLNTLAAQREAIDRLRAAGCICEDPLADDTDHLDTACPIAGHGIPF